MNKRIKKKIINSVEFIISTKKVIVETDDEKLIPHYYTTLVGCRYNKIVPPYYIIELESNSDYAPSENQIIRWVTGRSNNEEIEESIDVYDYRKFKTFKQFLNAIYHIGIYGSGLKNDFSEIKNWFNFELSI